MTVGVRYHCVALHLRGTELRTEPSPQVIDNEDRIPFSNPKVQALGIIADSNNFASDFFYTDNQGSSYHDDPQRIENWDSYGKPIYAPGAGRVIATEMVVHRGRRAL